MTRAIQLVISIFIVYLAACKTTEKTFDAEKEKTAIKAVVAAETEAYYKQDFEAWKETFLQTEEFKMYGYWDGWPEKVKFYNGFNSFRDVKQKQFSEDKTVWKGSIEERTNEEIKIHGNFAVYTFDQYSYSADKKKFLGKSLETRMLEKREGKWKISYLGFYYLPEEELAKTN
jgi:hypothetical protein